MGGRVGLKGTDGVVDEARAAGAEPVAPTRARAFAETILALSRGDPSLSIRWLTAAGPMGSEPLRAAGVGEEPLEIVSRPPEATTARDTRRAVEACIDRGAELVLFCGGDGTAKTLVEPTLVQAGKLQVAEVTEESTREELADHFRELFAAEPDTLFFLGPGSTIASIASVLGLEKTLLGIDAVFGGRTIAKDLDERSILRLLEEHPKAKLVVSPIGAQGFLLGRGNLEASPDVLRRIGTRNVIAVATPGKLAMTPVLRVDTGDAALDEEFRRREYVFVLIGYRTSKLHPIQR